MLLHQLVYTKKQPCRRGRPTRSFTWEQHRVIRRARGVAVSGNRAANQEDGADTGAADAAGQAKDPRPPSQETAAGVAPQLARMPSMRLAHFIHRYPPALGGSEDYFARLSQHLAAAGHRVTVHT